MTVKFVEEIIRTKKGLIEKTRITDTNDIYKEITTYNNDELTTEITNTMNGVNHGLHAKYRRGIFTIKEDWNHGELSSVITFDGLTVITVQYENGIQMYQETKTIQRSIDSY